MAVKLIDHITMERLLLYLHKTLLVFFKRWSYNKFGARSIIISPIKTTPKYIYIGKNVFIYKNARIQGIRKYNNTYYNPIIIFSDKVSVQQNLHLTCANCIRIGANTAIGANVTITDIHHPYCDIMTPIEEHDIEVRPVSIGEDSKIYNNTVILPGVTIGKHVTIGANSVVTKNIPDFCVAVGSPARIIKRFCFNSNQWKKTNDIGEFV